jgi:hypothetical protein
MPAQTAELAAIDARLDDWAAALQLLRAEADEATTRVRLRVMSRAERASRLRARAASLRRGIAPGSRGWRGASAAVRDNLDRLGRLVAGDFDGDESE